MNRSPALNATVDSAALTLMMLAWATERESTVAAMRDHASLSEDSYQREVLCLRAFTTYLACYNNSIDPVQTALREAADSFYRVLASDSIQTASEHQIALLDTLLNTMRDEDPERYRELSELRKVAPWLYDVRAHYDRYWKAFRWWTYSPEKNHIGAAFCEYCQSESEELQVAAEDEFRALVRTMNNYFERTTVLMRIKQ